MIQDPGSCELSCRRAGPSPCVWAQGADAGLQQDQWGPPGTAAARARSWCPPWVGGTGLVETAPTSAAWLPGDARRPRSTLEKAGRRRRKRREERFPWPSAPRAASQLLQGRQHPHCAAPQALGVSAPGAWPGPGPSHMPSACGQGCTGPRGLWGSACARGPPHQLLLSRPSVRGSVPCGLSPGAQASRAAPAPGVGAGARDLPWPGSTVAPPVQAPT